MTSPDADQASPRPLATFVLRVNGQTRQVTADSAMPLLWVLRDLLGLTGTKFGCGAGYCGACTVHLDGVARRSCLTPVGGVGRAAITTIEGLSPNGDHVAQAAWRTARVPQCGYCQVGQIMTAAALLAARPRPDREEVDRTMGTVRCRCGTHGRIREALDRLFGGPESEA